MVKEILDAFDIHPRDLKKTPNRFPDALPKLDEFTREGLLRIMVIGFIIDGELSWKEKRTLKKIYNQQILPWTVEQINAWCKDFSKGNGLEGLL